MSDNEHPKGKALVPAGSRRGAVAPTPASQSDHKDQLAWVVKQEGNSAAGHIGGRDVNNAAGDLYVHNEDVHNETAQTTIYNQLPPPVSHLARLYKRLATEVADDVQLTAYISQLEIFTRTVDDDKVIGLEGKLSAAGRNSEIRFAMLSKEAVFAQLRERMFSRTYQLIVATLMGKVYESFQANILPLIEAKAPTSDINYSVYTVIVLPLVAELEACEDFDEAPEQLIRGIIYFLTGNCHLRWA